MSRFSDINDYISNSKPLNLRFNRRDKLLIPPLPIEKECLYIFNNFNDKELNIIVYNIKKYEKYKFQQDFEEGTQKFISLCIKHGKINFFKKNI